MKKHLVGLVGAFVLLVGPAMTSCREARALQLADFDGNENPAPRRSPDANDRSADPLGNRTGITPGSGHAVGIDGAAGSGAKSGAGSVAGPVLSDGAGLPGRAVGGR